MDYFRLRQNQNYVNPPRITNIQDVVARRLDVTKENTDKINNINVVFSGNTKVDFIDIVDEQLFLVSENVKAVFQMYEPVLEFKEICILNYQTDQYSRYFLPLFESLDCISEESSIAPDKSEVMTLVLKSLPVEKCIFKVAGLFTDIVIIRLDVAESLLRREITRFTLERVKTEGKRGEGKTYGKR